MQVLTGLVGGLLASLAGALAAMALVVILRVAGVGPGIRSHGHSATALRRLYAWLVAHGNQKGLRGLPTKASAGAEEGI